MIELLIFHLHIVGAVYAYAKNWQTRGKKEAALAVMLVGLMFAIGWAITASLAGIIMPHSWKSPYFTVDTLSLVMLIIPEILFFNYFIIKDKETPQE